MKCVYCNNKSADGSGEVRRRSLYRFPNPNKYPFLNKTWLINANLENVRLSSKHMFTLCSDHFTADCFVNNTLKLRPDSIPTLFNMKLNCNHCCVCQKPKIHNMRSLHKFPRTTSHRMKMWIDAIPLRNFKATKYDRICSEHFLKRHFAGAKGFGRLNAHVVPTLFKIPSDCINNDITDPTENGRPSSNSVIDLESSLEDTSDSEAESQKGTSRTQKTSNKSEVINNKGTYQSNFNGNEHAQSITPANPLEPVMIGEPLPYTFDPITCRGCSFKHNSNVSLFQPQTTELTDIGKLLETCLMTKIDFGDLYPTAICELCIRQLNKYAVFQKSVQRMHRNFSRNLERFQMTQMQSDVIYTNRSNSESETITDLSDDSDDNLTESTLSTEETMMFDSNEMAEPESDSTLSSDENAHQHSLAQFTISFFDNNDICEETAETIVDTLDAPLDNGTDTFVCTLCSKVFRGKVAYDRHICKGNIPDNPKSYNTIELGKRTPETQQSSGRTKYQSPQ